MVRDTESLWDRVLDDTWSHIVDDDCLTDFPVGLVHDGADGADDGLVEVASS